jgi:hypothetical protein
MTQKVVQLYIPQLVKEALLAVFEEADHEVVVVGIGNVRADKELTPEEQLADSWCYLYPNQLQIIGFHKFPINVTHRGILLWTYLH